MDKQEWFEKCETEDFEYLTDFNELLKIRSLGRTPKGTFFDVSGFTKDDRFIEIELKRREITLDDLLYNKTFKEGIMVEAEKISDMLLDHTIKDTIPLYINFLKDGHIVVYNFLKFKQLPKRKKTKIYNNGNGEIEKVTRYYLPISEGKIYKKLTTNIN